MNGFRGSLIFALGWVALTTALWVIAAGLAYIAATGFGPRWAVWLGRSVARLMGLRETRR